MSRETIIVHRSDLTVAMTVMSNAIREDELLLQDPELDSETRDIVQRSVDIKTEALINLRQQVGAA